MTKTWCVGGGPNSGSINQIVYEQLKPKTEKLVKVIKSGTKLISNFYQVNE